MWIEAIFNIQADQIISFAHVIERSSSERRILELARHAPVKPGNNAVAEGPIDGSALRIGRHASALRAEKIGGVPVMSQPKLDIALRQVGVLEACLG